MLEPAAGGGSILIIKNVDSIFATGRFKQKCKFNSTICRDSGWADRESMGATEDVLRISVGIEHLEDIWLDIDQALDIIKD